MTRPAPLLEALDGATNSYSAPQLGAIEKSLVEVHSLIHRVELAVVDLGVPIAPLYLASARGSLRHVSACLAHHAAHVMDPARDEVVVGSGIYLRPCDGRPGIGERVRAAGLIDDPGAELQPRPVVPDLGADLVRSPEAKSICGGPVGATLMFAALAHHRWFHLRTRRKWSTDVSGARTLVAALTAGAGFDMPADGAVAQMVDARVVDVLAGLGWKRLVTPAMPP